MVRPILQQGGKRLVQEIQEHIIRAASSSPDPNASAGVDLHVFVSASCGAAHMSTGIARFSPAAQLPWHLHHFSEAITVLRGTALVQVEDRAYRMQAYDCLHVPAETAHLVMDEGTSEPLVAHWAVATENPSRVLINQDDIARRHATKQSDCVHEHFVHPDKDTVYELAPGAFFSDGFARRFGSRGICGGYGRFLPGASLPCHTHDFDESITIVAGQATCMVQGRRYELLDCDTAFIPRGLPHRFLNTSGDDMAMVWVYAGAEPDRQIVDANLCMERSGKPISTLSTAGLQRKEVEL